MKYYDYSNDFPCGNGWSTYYINDPYYRTYDGEVILSPDYVFEKGKYEGRSLQQIINRCWKGIIKYIDYGLIFISKECFDDLRCEKKILDSVRAANDAKLCFEEINCVDDELIARPLMCSVEGQSFFNVAINEPKYLSRLINRGYYFRIRQNNRYFAEDISFSIFGEYGNIDKIGNIIKQLEERGIDNDLTSSLREIVDYIEDCIREENENRRELEAYYREEEERYYYENEGYWAAFEGDPEAEWNID